jgi:hypothetical protein
MVMLSEGWDDILRGLLDRPEIGAVGAGLLYPAKPSSMPAFFSAGGAGRFMMGFTRAAGNPGRPTGGT